MKKSVSVIMDVTKQSEKNCFLAILETNGEAIKYVENPSDNLIKMALRLNGNNIRFIPDDKKTDDICFLAIIHGAAANLIDTTTPDIEAFLRYKKISKGWYSSITKVNGESIGSCSIPESFMDIPEYYQYYADFEFSFCSPRNTNELFIKDGNMVSMAYCSSSIRKELLPKKKENSNILDDNGEINDVMLKNIINKSPEKVFELVPKDKMKKSYIYGAILKGLQIKEYPEIFDYMDFKTVVKAYISRVKQFHASGRWSKGIYLSINEIRTFKYLFEEHGKKEEISSPDIINLLSAYKPCSIGAIFGFVEYEEIGHIRLEAIKKYTDYYEPFDSFNCDYVLSYIDRHANTDIKSLKSFLENVHPKIDHSLVRDWGYDSTSKKKIYELIKPYIV